MVWTDKQIEYWHLTYDAYIADKLSVAIDACIDQQRQVAQQEMLQLLNSFLHKELTLQDFNMTLKKKANGLWNVFHVRGMSGSIFLNKLLEYIPDEDHLAQLLHVTLRLPKDTKEGYLWMQALMQFLENMVVSRQISRMQLQPSRIPFFLSIWWHIQAAEQWPIPYLAEQRAIMSAKEDLEIIQDPIKKYFEFQQRFISLTNKLRLSPWQLDYLLIWSEQQQIEQKNLSSKSQAYNSDIKQGPVNRVFTENVATQEVSDTVVDENISPPHEIQEGSCRSHIQWLLAKLGHKIGCQVWIRATDRHRVWHDECLGTFSLLSLPSLADTALQQEIEQIDVLWLLNNEIVAAYGIEQPHTSVSIGLLRLFDLGTFFPSEKMHLCMITPQDHFEKVRSELLRPIFQAQNLKQHCELIGQEVLLEHAEHILRWARNVLVINDLASLSTDGCDQKLSPRWSPTDQESLKSGA